jgi:hypothetical protein
MDGITKLVTIIIKMSKKINAALPVDTAVRGCFAIATEIANVGVSILENVSMEIIAFLQLDSTLFPDTTVNKRIAKEHV